MLKFNYNVYLIYLYEHCNDKNVFQINLIYDFGNITLKYHYNLTQIRWFIVHQLIPMKTSLLKG